MAGWHGGLVELGPRQHLRHGIILRASEPPEGVLDILQQLYDISARTGCGWRQPLSTPPPENGLGQKPFHFTPCSLKLPGVVVPPRQLASSEQRPTRPSGPRFFCLSRFQNWKSNEEAPNWFPLPAPATRVSSGAEILGVALNLDNAPPTPRPPHAVSFKLASDPPCASRRHPEQASWRWWAYRRRNPIHNSSWGFSVSGVRQP